MLKLSLAVPCFNEQDNVETFYNAVRTAFDGKFSYEMVFVDDGSSDETLLRLKALYDLGEEKVTVVSFSRNFGKEAAVCAALKHCRGELICIIDADMQQTPETVLEMVAYLDENPDCDCVAAYQDKRIESGFMTFCKSCFYSVINKVSETYFYPSASDFRTFRRPVLDAVLSMGEYRRFSKGIFSWVGFKTHFMPYTALERHSGKSKFSFKKLMKYALNGIISFTSAPLKLPLYLGGIFSVGAVIWLIIALAAGAADILVILAYITLMTGIVLIALGIAGEYISEIYIEGKKRPLYIEKTCLSYPEEDSYGQD